MSWLQPSVGASLLLMSAELICRLLHLNARAGMVGHFTHVFFMVVRLIQVEVMQFNGL